MATETDGGNIPIRGGGAYLRGDRRPILRDEQDLLLLFGNWVLDEDDYRHPVALGLPRRAVGALPLSGVALGIRLEKKQVLVQLGLGDGRSAEIFVVKVGTVRIEGKHFHEALLSRTCRTSGWECGMCKVYCWRGS